MEGNKELAIERECNSSSTPFYGMQYTPQPPASDIHPDYRVGYGGEASMAVWGEWLVYLCLVRGQHCTIKYRAKQCYTRDYLERRHAGFLAALVGERGGNEIICSDHQYKQETNNTWSNGLADALKSDMMAVGRDNITIVINL